MLQRTLDTAAFLGTDPVRTVRIGRSPHEIVFRQGPAALRHFPVPAGVARTAPPVFVSMPLINTWTVWDLLPGLSVLEALTNAGIPVYLLDWGRPGPEDAHRPLAYYIDELMGRMVDRAERHAAAQYRAEKLDAIGYCVGGTFLSVYVSRNPERFRQAAFVCTPIDFHQSGRLATWANPQTFPLDALVAGPRNFPAWRMADSFAWLRPSGTPRKWMSLWERIYEGRPSADDHGRRPLGGSGRSDRVESGCTKAPQGAAESKGIDKPGFPELWAALEQWNTDGVDFPGEAYREYVRSCYFDNALIEGGWILGTRPVDLGNAKIPALVIAAAGDHIAPAEACSGLERVWGGPTESVEIKGGHVGVSLNKELHDALIAWCAR